MRSNRVGCAIFYFNLRVSLIDENHAMFGIFPYFIPK